MNQHTAHAAPPGPVSRGQALRTFGRIGLMSFGGPAAQIALMHRVLVDEKKWLTEREFLSALNFCMLLPGPEAMQLATFAGWRLGGVAGGLVAGLLFVLPGAATVLGLAVVYAWFGQMPLIGALFVGVKAAVLVIVVEALVRIAGRALSGTLSWAIALCAFVAIFFLALPFPMIIAAAALVGFVSPAKAAPGPQQTPLPRVPAARTAATIAIWLALWWTPVIAIDLMFDLPLLATIGVYFSKLAVVTFGGAYAVLAYMAQAVVTDLGWLTAGEMTDGLGLAETTPGPLILVTQFVGFLAAFREGGLAMGLAGAALTLWVTFVPCFLWIFAGAPYIGWIGAQPRLAGALSAITAAVVGVIANLSLWFALHVAFGSVTRREAGPLVLWQPDLATMDWRVFALAGLCAVLLLWLRLGLGWVLAAAMGAGWLLVVFF